MIKNVSSTFKANCKKDSVKYREYIIIDNKEVDIKGNLSDTAYKDTTFFGKFNLKMLKFETENGIDYKKKELKYYKEVDGEAIKIGTFIVTEVKDSDTFESVNVTAYDYGLKFANSYTTKLDYSSGKITLLQQIQEICTNCEVEFENTTLPNGSFIIDSNQFVNGEQYGDVIAQASGINVMFATINSNDKLEFIFQNETNEIIEDYVELDDKRDTHPITSVLVAPSEELETAGAVLKDEALIEQYGEHWLKIYSYGYAYSTEKCQQLVSAIFNQVKGFGYSSFKSEYSFLPYLTLGDKIQFKNKEGQLVNSLILRYETDYDEITFEAPSIINASVEYNLPETAEKIAQRASIEINKANAEIVLKTNSDGKITQVRLDGNADDGTIIELNADQINLTADDILNLIAGNEINLTSKNIAINSTNFKVDKDGKITSTSGKIGGYNIEKDQLFAEMYAPHDYTLEDAETARKIASGVITPTAEQIAYYDIDGDGVVTFEDYYRIRIYYEYHITTTKSAKFILQTGDFVDSAISLLDGNNIPIASLGFKGLILEGSISYHTTKSTDIFGKASFCRTLYDNPEGTNQTITLEYDEQFTSLFYNELEIIYGHEDYGYSSCKIPINSSSVSSSSVSYKVNLSASVWLSNIFYQTSSLLTLSGNTATFSNSVKVTNGSIENRTTSILKVYKIIGYFQ